MPLPGCAGDADFGEVRDEVEEGRGRGGGKSFYPALNASALIKTTRADTSLTPGRKQIHPANLQSPRQVSVGMVLGCIDSTIDSNFDSKCRIQSSLKSKAHGRFFD